MWSRINKREKILLIVLLLVGLFYLYYMYLYQPLKVEINELKKEKQLKEARFIEELVLVKELPGLRDRYNKLKEVEKIELKFSTLTPEDFLELLEKISRETGARLTAYIPEKKDNVTILDIAVEGDYRHLNSFLAGLKKLANQLDVNTLIVRPHKEVLQMKMVLHYTRKKTGGDTL